MGAFVDLATKSITVGNLGDSRAVLGVFEDGYNHRRSRRTRCRPRASIRLPTRTHPRTTIAAFLRRVPFPEVLTPPGVWWLLTAAS